MKPIKDLKQLVQGDYLTVSEVSHGFEIEEKDAGERLDRLVDEKEVLRRLLGGRYAPAYGVEAQEMAEEFNKEFADVRNTTSRNLF
jgi:hypothetical protein